MAGSSGSEERRLVTCLFVDVVGSTELTLGLGPERLKAALGSGFAELRAIVEREGGTIEKFIGDAIYVLFGAPAAHQDDAERALRAAAAARDWSAKRVGSEFPLAVRVGLETGEAIVDLAAASETRQQMSVGAVVNTAARLQQRAEPGQVLVGPVAHEATADLASFTSLGLIELKGLGAIEVWALDRIVGRGARRRLPFVGREAELELLRIAAKRAVTRSVLALVSGPPGQGKTRLVEELLSRLGGIRVLSARCRPGGEIGAFAPLRDLLLGDRPDDALDAVVAEAIADPAERLRVADALGHAAGVRASGALASLGKDEREDEIQNAWRRFARGLGAASPLALWIEDLHWAAPEVVRLVDRLSLSGEPLLVIATARPEFAQAAGLRPSGDRIFIELEGLEAGAAHALAASAGGLPAILARAEGNPLFIVELARMHEPGALPLTLQGALGARLDDLAPTERSLLASAAVVGETFDAQDCAFLCGTDAPSAARALARLADLHYLQQVDGRFRFHHSLLRDVAYGRLLAADRLRLHARYARERADADPEVRAHHWWAAVGAPEAEWVWRDDPQLESMRREAFRAHLEAGRHQVALFATDRALTSVERAFALAPDERGRAEAKLALAEAHANELHGDESWQAYLEARDHFAAAGGPVPPALYLGALKARLRYGAFRRPPAPQQVRALIGEAQTAARSSGDPGTLALTLLYSGFKDMDPATGPGDPALMEEAVRLSARADPATRREILGWRANDLIQRIEVDRALAAFEEIEAIPGEVSDFDRLELLRGRALVAFRRGRLDELVALAEQVVTLSRRMGPHLRTHADATASHAAFARADWDATIALAAETDRLMRSAPLTPFCAAAATTLAHGAAAHARAGRHEEARALATQIDGIAYEHVTPVLRSFALVLTGDPVAVDIHLGPYVLAWNAVTAVTCGQHDAALPLAAALEGHARGGARFYGALAEAVREEVASDGGGPAPNHDALREIGYLGWSAVLRARAPTA